MTIAAMPTTAVATTIMQRIMRMMLRKTTRAATAIRAIATAAVAKAIKRPKTTATTMQIRNNGRLLGLLLGCTWYLGACSTIYDETQHLEGQAWQQNQALAFEFDIQDTTQLYDVYLEVKHGTTYPYQNIYCWITTTMPDGSERSEQHSLELANAKGYWLGDCGEAACERRIPFMIKTTFPFQGRYGIQFEQYSRQANLSPIEYLRLYVSKSS